MKRLLLTTTTVSAMLALAAPGVASAHHRAERHHHHARHASTNRETAGTVASFTGGVLTITLTNGSTVSGQVTDQTEIRCLPSASPTAGENQGDDRGRGDDRSSRDRPHAGGGDQGDDNGPGDGQSCTTTAALVAGAAVREAQLRVSSAGAVWGQVALIG